MKYLLLLLMLNIGCSQSQEDTSAYPGRYRFGECYSAWQLGYTEINIPKCERDRHDPKFKIGQKVMILGTMYDKTCRGLITSLFFWNTVLNENEYRLNILCHNQELYNTAMTESNLKEIE